MPKKPTKQFGTSVDVELLARFQNHLPRSYSYKHWLETMMMRTLDMSEVEMQAAFSEEEEQ